MNESQKRPQHPFRQLSNLVQPVRRLLPPDYVVALAFLPYVIVSMIYLVEPTGRDLEALERSRLAIVFGAAIAYASFRVMAFHPYCNASYFHWLRLTPWRYPTPLPLGPPEICAIDFGWIFIFLGAVWPAEPSVYASLMIAYIATTTICMTFPLWALSFRREAYCSWFGLGLVVWSMWYSMAVAVVVSVIVYGLTLYFQRRSWNSFPWEGKTISELKEVFVQYNPKWGFPYDELHPIVPKPASHLDRVCSSLLVGWLGTAFVWGASFDQAMFLLAPLGFLSVILLPVIRIGVYQRSRTTPISFWGRLATGRLIIWSFDNYLVAPMLVAVVGGGAMLVIATVELPLAIPWISAICILVLWYAPPSATTWRLTAKARLTDAGHKAQKKTFDQN